MIEKTKPKTYTVADLYAEAGRMVTQEMQTIKNRPLTSAEEAKTKALAKLISNSVLKEMKIV